MLPSPSIRVGGLFESVPEANVLKDVTAVFVVALALRAWTWSSVGTRVLRDATRYVTWCSEFSLGTLFGTRALAYAGYWLPYCGWLRASGGSVRGWIGVQVVLSALACVVVYMAGRHLVDRTAGLVAGSLLAFQWEVFRWATRPQSEFLLTFAVALTIWRLGHYRSTPTRRNRLLTLGSLGVVALVRPNGLPIVGAYLLYDLLPSESDRRLDLGFPAPVTASLLATLVAAVGYRLQFGWARGSAIFHWRNGIIITPDRFVYGYTPESATGVVDFFAANAEHVVAIATLRGIWFFSPVMPGWSTTHALKAGLTLTPLTLLAALGLWTALRRREWDLLVLWGTPLAAVVATAMAIWVAGWRNFLGPAVVVYSLFAGYYVSQTDWPRRIRAVTPG